jgi:hypothetical protein
VKRYIAAAIHPMHGDAAPGAFGCIPQQVFSPAAPPKGVCWGMFEQQQRRRALTAGNFGCISLLELPGLLVRNQAQV